MSAVRVRFLFNWDGVFPTHRASYEEQITVELDDGAVPLEGDRITRNGNTYEVLRRSWNFSDEDPGYDVTVRADTFDVIHRRELRRKN